MTSSAGPAAARQGAGTAQRRERAASLRPATPILAGALLFLLCPATAWAQAGAQDFLYISGQVDTISSAGHGGGGGVEWLHLFSERSDLNLGVFSFSLAGSRWTYGKVAGDFKSSDKTTLFGEVDAGGGRQAGGTFVYHTYKVGITRALVSKRFYGEAEDQYIDIGKTKGNLIRVGAIFSPVHSLTARLNYHFSTAGNLNSYLVSGRADAHLRRFNLLTGLAIGRAPPQLFNLITGANVVTHSEEFFGGISVPARKYEVTLVLNTVRVAGINKYAISFNWKLPLGSVPGH